MVSRNCRIRKVVLHFVYSDEIGRKENNTTLYREFLVLYDVVFYLYNIIYYDSKMANYHL